MLKKAWIKVSFFAVDLSTGGAKVWGSKRWEVWQCRETEGVNLRLKPNWKQSTRAWKYIQTRKAIYSFADLETVGLQLGAMEMEKKILVSKSDFDGAKVKREEMDTLRDEAYR